MSWENDYMRNGRPFRSGWNIVTGVWEYGSVDQEAGLSFADALREHGLHVAEDARIEGTRTTLGSLVAQNALYFGPATPDVIEPPVTDGQLTLPMVVQG